MKNQPLACNRKMRQPVVTQSISVMTKESMWPISCNNYRKSSKNIASEILDWKNVEPSTFFVVYFIVIVIAKKKNDLIDCSAFLSDSSTKKIYVLRAPSCHNSYIFVVIEYFHECS